MHSVTNSVLVLAGLPVETGDLVTIEAHGAKVEGSVIAALYAQTPTGVQPVAVLFVDYDDVSEVVKNDAVMLSVMHDGRRVQQGVGLRLVEDDVVRDGVFVVVVDRPVVKGVDVVTKVQSVVVAEYDKREKQIPDLFEVARFWVPGLAA